MLFLYATLVVFLVNAFLLYLNTMRCEYLFKHRYPTLTIVKTHWTVKAISFIKFAFVAICPILNLVIAWYMVFYSEDMCEEVIQDLYRGAMTQKGDEDE